LDFLEFLDTLQRRATVAGGTIEREVQEILLKVKEQGDRAVLAYTRKFDDKKAEILSVSPAEINKIAAKAKPEIVKALENAARRIRKFHEMQAESSWSFSEDDTVLGQIIRPLKRVGVYVPGGKAAYPSTVLMNVVPAQVAGVREIALCVPVPGVR